MLIFANEKNNSIKRLVDTLNLYEKWLGQKINKEKSTLFPSKLISLDQKRNLLQITGFKEGKFPVMYLGVPLISGRLTN